jgi:hypothetical protein
MWICLKLMKVAKTRLSRQTLFRTQSKPLFDKVEFMPVKPAEIMVRIGGEGTTEHEELSRLSEGLREELIEAGAESVERLHGDAAPAGSKGDPITLATLLVTLAPTALTGLIAMLQSWVTRHERATLTLQRGEEKITVAGPLSQDQRRVITDWLQTGKAS